MSQHAVLNYATPPRHPLAPRVNWLAVFAFAWTFAVSPTVMLLFVHALDGGVGTLPSTRSIALKLAALILTPAVALGSAFVATERGAPWDSPYRWTQLAVCAAPFGWIMLGSGFMFWVGEVL
jgi:hypothetical protein